MPRATLTILGLATLLCGGCGQSMFADPQEDYVKPTIAVMKFENRASFPLGWNLGDGMADILVDRLVASNRYHVLERPELAAVMSEIRLQHSGATRTENRAATGKLKNVQYLIKGTVTDFGHVSGGTGFLGTSRFDILGRSNDAVMGMTIYVVDVESGQIICSESIQESVRTTELNVKAVYKDVGLGGSTFYSTPLGKATARVIDRSLKRINDAIASRPWEPKVAMVKPTGEVIINGGANRGLQGGTEYTVMEPGEPIVDPDNGDIIGHQPGRTLARVRLTDVRDRYAVAAITSGRPGDVQIGCRCQRVAPPALTLR